MGFHGCVNNSEANPQLQDQSVNQQAHTVRILKRLAPLNLPKHGIMKRSHPYSQPRLGHSRQILLGAACVVHCIAHVSMTHSAALAQHSECTMSLLATWRTQSYFLWNRQASVLYTAQIGGYCCATLRQGETFPLEEWRRQLKVIVFSSNAFGGIPFE